MTLELHPHFLKLLFLILETVVASTSVYMELNSWQFCSDVRPDVLQKDIDHFDIFLSVETTQEYKVFTMTMLTVLKVRYLCLIVCCWNSHRMKDIVRRW